MNTKQADPARREKHGVTFLPVVYGYLKSKADKMGVSVSELVNRVFMAEMGMPFTAEDRDASKGGE